MTISEGSLSISEDPTQGRAEKAGWCITNPQEAQRVPLHCSRQGPLPEFSPQAGEMYSELADVMSTPDSSLSFSFSERISTWLGINSCAPKPFTPWDLTSRMKERKASHSHELHSCRVWNFWRVRINPRLDIALKLPTPHPTFLKTPHEFTNSALCSYENTELRSVFFRNGAKNFQR